MIDLYLLTRDLPDDEQAELEAAATCCWDTVYEKYTSPDKYVAYRMVAYSNSPSTDYIGIIQDRVALEVTDREDSDGNADYTNYDIFARDVSSTKCSWKFTETHTVRD